MPFTSCISKIYNTQVDNVKDLNVVMLIYNLIEYSNNYAKTESFWQYPKDVPSDPVTYSELFKFKAIIT